MSMFVAMTASAVPARVAGFSSATASAIAVRTSGGRLVDVSVMSLIKLSLNDSIACSPMRRVYRLTQRIKREARSLPFSVRTVVTASSVLQYDSQEREQHQRLNQREA